MRVITSSEIERLVTLKEVRAVMEETLRAADRYPQSPARFAMGEGSGRLGVMPETGDTVHAIKIVSLAKGRGHAGLMVIFDAASGEPRGILEAGAVTALRTAAVSVVVTQALLPDPKRIALVGRGRQALAHRAAFEEAFPRAQIRESMEGCEVICTLTTASQPLAFPPSLPERLHINAVGSCTPDRREIPTDIMKRAHCFVDSLERARKEAGDLVLSGVTEATPVEEMLASPGLFRPEKGLTVFKSLGLPCEDLALGKLILERADV